MLKLAAVGRHPDSLAALLAVLEARHSGPLLFRCSEGFNRERILCHGTDRAARAERELAWQTRGYRGPERLWSELIFASTADDVRRSLAGEIPSSAFLKIAETPEPLLLVYDQRAFENVRDREYALRKGQRFRASLLGLYDAALPLRSHFDV